MSERDEALRKARQTMRRLQHEVRTPISQIIGYAELLEEELEDRGAEDLAPDLQKIREAAQRLLDLADGKLRDEQDAGAPVLPEVEVGRSSEAGAEDGASEPWRDSVSRVLVVDDDANDRELSFPNIALDADEDFRLETWIERADGSEYGVNFVYVERIE